MTNPQCPACHGARTIKSGKTKAGTQRYKCKAAGCLKLFTGAKVGRPLIGDRARTDAENQRAAYARLSPEQRKAYNRRRREGKRKKGPTD